MRFLAIEIWFAVWCSWTQSEKLSDLTRELAWRGCEGLERVFQV